MSAVIDRNLKRHPGMLAVQRSLKRRQWRFAVHYVALGAEHGQGAEAARRAGWPESSAAVRACELMRDPKVRAAIEAIREYCETTDEIDERLIINGIAKVAIESEDDKAKMAAWVALAKIRRMGAFGGVTAAPGLQVNSTQNVLILQQAGIDPVTGVVRDASKALDALTRAFGAEQAAALAVQVGLAVPAAATELEPVVLDITPADAEMMADNANDLADDGVSD